MYFTAEPTLRVSELPGSVVYFCSTACKQAFDVQPGKYPLSVGAKRLRGEEERQRARNLAPSRIFVDPRELNRFPDIDVLEGGAGEADE